MLRDFIKSLNDYNSTVTHGTFCLMIQACFNKWASLLLMAVFFFFSSLKLLNHLSNALVIKQHSPSQSDVLHPPLAHFTHILNAQV